MKNAKCCWNRRAFVGSFTHWKASWGSPSNFAYHTQQQGAFSCIVSAVGNDSYGNEIKEALLKKILQQIIYKL